MVVIILLAGISAYVALSGAGNTTSSIMTASSSSTLTSTSSTSSSSVASQISSNQSLVFPCGGSVWITYHCDYSRSGVDANESNINSPSINWTSPKLDGNIYAEPIIAYGEVYVATENNSVYALNATNGEIIWHTNVGTPSTSGMPCGDINPLGITGTPVLDLSTRTLYFVSEVSGGDHILHGIDVATGSVVYSRNIDPPGSTPIDQQQRPALALNHGIVYIELGGLYGDCGTYHGWVIGAQLNDSSKPLYTFEVAPNDSQGGIWEVGGVSIAPSGDLYIASGNSQGAKTYDYGDGVIQLSPTLQVLSYFAPSDYAQLNQQDQDLGTTGPIQLNNQSLVFEVGKEGVGYLLNQSSLGGINGSLYSAQVCASAYSADASYNEYIYVPCTNGLNAIQLNSTTRNPSFANVWSTDSFMSGAPIVSGNAVWTLDTDDGTLFALSPTTGATLYSQHLGSVTHFETPASADGKILVGASNQIFAISIST